MGRNLEKGSKIVTDIEALNGKASFIRCNVSDEKSVKEAAEKITSEFNRIDVLLEIHLDFTIWLLALVF